MYKKAIIIWIIMMLGIWIYTLFNSQQISQKSELEQLHEKQIKIEKQLSSYKRKAFSHANKFMKNYTWYKKLQEKREEINIKLNNQISKGTTRNNLDVIKTKILGFSKGMEKTPTTPKDSGNKN